MDIDGLGDKLVEQLVERGLVEDVADLPREAVPVGGRQAESPLRDVALDNLHPAAGRLARGRRHARLHQRGHACAGLHEAVSQAAADEAGIPGQEHLSLQHGAAPYYTF